MSIVVAVLGKTSPDTLNPALRWSSGIASPGVLQHFFNFGIIIILLMLESYQHIQNVWLHAQLLQWFLVKI